MASDQVKTGEMLSKRVESYNGCSRSYSQRKSVVEKSSGGTSGRKFDLTVTDIPAQVLTRFHTFVNKTHSCWLWTAGVDKDGYGQLARPHRSPLKTHRLAWLLAHGGRLSSRQHVLHRCDVPRCVNPDHLFLGDQDANMKDAAAKGRLHGERHNKQTVPQWVVDFIRNASYQRGTQNELARRFGVSKTYISLIRRGLRRQFSAPVPAVAASHAVPRSHLRLQPSVARGVR
jgi:hypothetical protein